MCTHFPSKTPSQFADIYTNPSNINHTLPQYMHRADTDDMAVNMFT